MDLSIFGSPGRTSVEDERDLSSPGRAEVRKAELQIFGSQGSAEVRKRNFTTLKVPAEMKCGNGLTILGRPGRTIVKDERDLSKS